MMNTCRVESQLIAHSPTSSFTNHHPRFFYVSSLPLRHSGIVDRTRNWGSVKEKMLGGKTTKISQYWPMLSLPLYSTPLENLSVYSSTLSPATQLSYLTKQNMPVNSVHTEHCPYVHSQQHNPQLHSLLRHEFTFSLANIVFISRQKHNILKFWLTSIHELIVHLLYRSVIPNFLADCKNQHTTINMKTHQWNWPYGLIVMTLPIVSQ